MAARIGVTVSSVTKRVPTYRRGINGAPGQRIVQHHRGYRGYIWIPGERQPEPCCDFHQKRRAAQGHAMRVARAIAKDEGLQPPLLRR